MVSKNQKKKKKEKTQELSDDNIKSIDKENDSNISKDDAKKESLNDPDVIEIDLSNIDWQQVIIYGLLILVPLAIFWQTKDFWFVWDDDRYHLQPNPYLKDLTFANFKALWSRIYVGMFIPAAYTVWGILKPIGQMFSEKPVDFHAPTYHLANVFLHVFNGLLVYKFITRFIKHKWSACIGALIFLVHPIQVESVAWISELRGLLATFFGFISLDLYLDRHKNLKFYMVLSLLTFALALLSKPALVVIPLIIGVYEFFYKRKNLLNSSITIAPWLAIAIPIIIVTRIAQPFSSSKLNSPIIYRPLVWMDSINFYLYKIINPLELTSFYARTPEKMIDNWILYVGWIIPVILIAYLWTIKDKHTPLTLGAAIFIAGFFPTSGLMAFDFQRWSTVADRYIYISMMGIGLMAAYGLSKFYEWQQNKDQPFLKIITWSFTGFIIFLWTLRGYTFQVPTWKNSVVLWDHCLSITPNEAQAYNNRGDGYSKQKKYKVALEDFNKAIELNKVYLQAYANRGSVLNNLGKYDDAIRDFDKAISLNRNYVDAHQKRAIVNYNKGDYQQSWSDVINLKKIKAPINMNLVRALKAKGIDITKPPAPISKTIQKKK